MYNSEQQQWAKEDEREMEKLSDTLLIRSKPSDLPDQVPDEMHPLGTFLQTKMVTGQNNENEKLKQE